MAKFVVARDGDIPAGASLLVHVKGRPIAIFNVNGEHFGVLDRCPHQGGSLCAGLLTGKVESVDPGSYSYTRRGEILRCPWHGWEFDLRTGKSLPRPGEYDVKSYKVSVERSVDDGAQYVAETVNVSVDAGFIVVEM